MKESSRKLLEETVNVIKQLETNEYTRELAVLNGNTIGRHIRHILDLFECLIESCKHSELNYDLRKRNPEIENSIKSAISKINRIAEEIEELNLRQKLKLTQTINNSLCEFETEVGRELLYNLQHTVHHLTIIRIGIEQNFPLTQIPINFGVAYSTRQYIQNCEA